MLALLASPLASHAQAPAADSLAPPPARVLITGVATAPAADSTRRKPWHEQPRFVMARSLLVPGWGQMHNRAWLKAVLVAGTEVWIGTRIVQDERNLERLARDLDGAQREPGQPRVDGIVNEYNALLDQRLGRQWMLAGVIAYALVDAYVDAHFRGFDLEFQNDPALPAGASPADLAGRSGRHRMRLALRWDF